MIRDRNFNKINIEIDFDTNDVNYTLSNSNLDLNIAPSTSFIKADTKKEIINPILSSLGEKENFRNILNDVLIQSNTIHNTLYMILKPTIQKMIDSKINNSNFNDLIKRIIMNELKERLLNDKQ